MSIIFEEEHEDYVRLRRSALEIKVEILQHLYNENLCPTRLMQKSNLGWNNFKKHLKYLKEKKLVIVEKRLGGKKKIYKTDVVYITAKGKEVVDKLMKLKELIEGDKDFP